MIINPFDNEQEFTSSDKLITHLTQLAVDKNNVFRGYDFPLVIQRIQFFILISGQPIIEPDFHNRSFLLWCADHARHTIAHNFLNSYQNKSGDFCFYFSNKIGGSICIWMIHRQIVVDHHFQKIIKLIVRTHIGVHDACNIGFFSLSTHSVPFSRSQFGQ